MENINLTAEKEVLRSVDRDAYVLKLKIASLLNGCFGTNIDMGRVEYMHFVDILASVSERCDPESLYAALKKVAKHGVAEEQKTFLYDHALIPFTPYEWDFDDYLEQMRSSLEGEVFKGTRVVVVPQYAQDEIGPDLMCFHSRPLVMMETFTLIPEEYPPTESILLQNGYVIVIHTLHSLDDTDAVRALKQITACESMHDDYDDDDDDDE